MNKALIALIALAPVASVAEEATPRAKEQCVENVTVFQDVSMLGRKDRLASNITDRHREMNANGWRFVDMEIYVENADIEGAFLTYARDVPCPPSGDS